MTGDDTTRPGMPAGWYGQSPDPAWTDHDLRLAEAAYEAATTGVSVIPWANLQNASKWRWVRCARAVMAADRSHRHGIGDR